MCSIILDFSLSFYILIFQFLIYSNGFSRLEELGAVMGLYVCKSRKLSLSKRSKGMVGVVPSNMGGKDGVRDSPDGAPEKRRNKTLVASKRITTNTMIRIFWR